MDQWFLGENVHQTCSFFRANFVAIRKCRSGSWNVSSWGTTKSLPIFNSIRLCRFIIRKMIDKIVLMCTMHDLLTHEIENGYRNKK